MLGRRANASVPDEIFEALVVSVEHEAAPLDKSAQAACDTVPEPFPFNAPLIVPAPPLAAAKVPLDILLALVVSVVADAANATLLVLVHVIAPVDATVQS